jgi:hypothetical protein
MESKATEHHDKVLKLSVDIVTPADVGRLLRELEDINANLLQLKVRDPESKVALPAVGKRMEKLVDLNSLNLLHVSDRTALKVFLTKIKEKAPQLHISFGAEPNPVFLDKLMTWLRKEIDPLVLLTIGLQPAIGAGCMLRTTNKYFDMSLRQTFIDKRQLLLEQLIPPAQGVVST